MSPRKPRVLRDGGGDRTLREHLIATAARLVAEQGSAGLTVRGIAREAQVADGVLYNHFATKEELLALALQAHVASVMHEVGTPPEPGSATVEANLRGYLADGVAVLVRIVPVFAGLLGQPKVLARFHELSPPSHADALPAALARYLRAEQQLGRVAAEVDVTTAASLMIGACHELVLPRLLLGGPASGYTVPPGFAEKVAATIVHGLAPRPAAT
jgi:AcrR family transcriptional regulator